MHTIGKVFLWLSVIAAIAIGLVAAHGETVIHAERGTERKLEAVLAKVRDVPPEPGDELGETAKGTSGRKRRITRR